jgi:NAD(P)H-dependent FMN reductase
LKIVALGASTSSNSINKKLATYAASLANAQERIVLDLNDYELPLFSEDMEKELGQPEAAHRFLADLSQGDAVIISFAEHNGTYTAAFKNTFDWASRIRRDIFSDLPTLLLATSPGGRGAQSVLTQAVNSLPRFGAKVVGELSVPSFYDAFDAEKNELTDPALNDKLQRLVSEL